MKTCVLAAAAALVCAQPAAAASFRIDATSSLIGISSWSLVFDDANDNMILDDLSEVTSFSGFFDSGRERTFVQQIADVTGISEAPDTAVSPDDWLFGPSAALGYPTYASGVWSYSKTAIPAVPVPASWVLLMAGLAALGRSRRRG